MKVELRFINEAKGRGVFAIAPIKKGELVVSSPIVLLDGREGNHVLATVLGNYYWDYPFNRKGERLAESIGCMVLGLGNLLNYSKTPNCTWNFDPKKHDHHVFASHNIEAGTELTLDYGYNPNAQAEYKVASRINKYLQSTKDWEDE